MKIIIAPDKFKGSLSTFEVCDAIKEGISRINSEIEAVSYPMADGGDGFAVVMKHYLGTTTVACETVDPLGRPITANYEWDEQNKTAIIEMALASGLVLLRKEERNPMATSTFGTGLMIAAAIKKGAARIILGLGGSATNDAGTGILSALGFRFLNERNEPVQASGKGLAEIRKIENPVRVPLVKFDIACDVQNTMYGKQGAAYIYAPQKGADPGQVIMLDNGLRNFAQVLTQQTGRDISGTPGTGAAGGIAAGLLSFFEVEMKKGIEMIVDASHIKNELDHAQLLITGEGRIDAQSRTGKVVGYLSSLAHSFDIPCSAICGEAALNEPDQESLGLRKIVSLADDTTSKEETMKKTKEFIVKKAGYLLEGL